MDKNLISKSQSSGVKGSVLPKPPVKKKSKRRRVAYGFSWLVGIPVLAFLLLYIALLINPVPVPFVGAQARAMVLNSLPKDMDLELGGTFLNLKDGVAPTLRFSPVVLIDRLTGGQVEMEALEVGFSPWRALLGQPGAQIAFVSPKLQVVQDLFGPRLAQFELVTGSNGADDIVRVIEGESSFPTIGIKSSGLQVGSDILGSPALTLRSDNDWLISNLLAAEEGLRSVLDNSERGVFSTFTIQNGTLEMLDSVYGLVRVFSEIELEMSVVPGTRDVEGKISAVIGGERMRGTISRNMQSDGSARLLNEIENMDFSAFVPFMDDPGAMVALHGTGGVIMDVELGMPDSPEVLGGSFLVDLNGMSLRIQDDDFLVQASPMEIDWDARLGVFTMKKTLFEAGRSSANIAGFFSLGLDENFGPTMRMSVNMSDVYLRPDDLGEPDGPIDQMQFVGWSAPLYGAIGIESFVATSGELKLVTSGRIDMLQSGIGIDVNVAIEGASADDLKRIWPYFLGGDTRDWFVKNVQRGKVLASDMKFSFAAGSLGGQGEEVTLPDGAMNVEMLAEGVQLNIGDDLEPVQITGLTHLKVDGSGTSIGFGQAILATGAGELNAINSTLSIAWGDNDDRVFAFDGELSAPISALMAIQNSTAPQMLADLDLPIDPANLSGDLQASLSTRIMLQGKENAVTNMQYSINGKLLDFASSEPVSDFSVSDGQLDFRIDQDNYKVDGPVKLNGLATDISISGALVSESEPEILVSALFDAQDFTEFGFDVTQFIGGKVRFTGQPLPNGDLKISVDLKDASMSVPDIGLTKSPGVEGALTALVKFSDQLIDITEIDLGFGTVSLRGEMQYDQQKGLQSADFSRFVLKEGDQAQIRLAPINGGYAIRLRGQQLDLKPMMQRFFSLESGGTGGPQVSGIDQTIMLDIELERALGFYKTTAIDLSANLSLHGEDLENVTLQTQFGGTNSLSITTNKVEGGRVMSVAFGDLGTLLRFVGTYPRLAGGEGSMVLTTDVAQKTDRGEFVLRNFSLIEEANVAQILGNNPNSRELIAQQNRLDFNSGKALFIRRPDSIEIVEAVVDGGNQGGTARGFIYTDAGQYDIVGTYIPLFELNNAFQQIPILGPLLGGREGEGLFGITFAVRGGLAEPEFTVNPLSLLVPGAFRTLFEFRAQEQPAR